MNKPIDHLAGGETEGAVAPHEGGAISLLPCPFCKGEMLQSVWGLPMCGRIRAVLGMQPPNTKPGPDSLIEGAPADAYTLTQQAFHRYWYSHMVQDVIVGVHAQTSYASAWEIWNAALAAQE